MRGGERVEKLFVQSKFTGEYERLMQDENGDEVRFMRDCELEEARKRPLVTRSHPVRTDEELRESFERNFVHENRDGSKRLLAAARERYGTSDMDEAFEKYKQEHLELHRQHEKIRSLEKFLRENATQIAQSRQSESRYYYYNGTVYRLSRHVYPTGSMTRGWPDGTFDKVDFAADPYLIDKVARDVDGKVVPLSAEAEDGGIRLMSEEEWDKQEGIELVKPTDVSEDNSRFNSELDSYVNGKMKRSDVITIKNYGNLMSYLPNSMKIILKQSVINKVLKKHNISVNTLRDLPEKLHNPVLVFKSARKDTDAVVVMIDAIDNDGNNIVVAIDLKGRFNQLEVNDITSIYGKDSYEGYANWAENIITGDEKKVKAWIQSLPENDRRGVSKSMLSRLQEKLHEVLVADKDSIKNPSMQENGGNNSQQEENGGGRATFMVNEERDADYMDAVKSGDAEKAGRMMREAAKRALPETKVVDENGEPRVMYHGTNLTRVNGGKARESVCLFRKAMTITACRSPTISVRKASRRVSILNR